MLAVIALILSSLSFLMVCSSFVYTKKYMTSTKKEVMKQIEPPTDDLNFNKINKAIKNKGFEPISELKAGKIAFYAKKDMVMYPLGEIACVDLRDGKISDILQSLEEIK